MIKKTLCFLLVCSLIFSASCKKNGSANGENAASIAPETAVPEQNTANETAVFNPNAKLAKMEFDKIVHDFGVLTPGETVETVFIFKNTGVADLIISAATGSCGCTVPEYPKAPVKVGEKGEIKVSFNSAGKSGIQNKTVSITANTANGTEQLTINASIPEKK